MAAILQLRRGSGSIDLSEGELYLNNGVGSIQFGSGSSNSASVIEYTLLPLNAPVNGNIKLVGDISASNLTLTGNLTVAQNITFGGTLITFGDANTDNVVITADLSSSIIPNDNNAFDLGASNKKWKNLYAVSASIDSISVPGSGILSSSGISFDLYTGSVDTKNSTLANVTESLISSASNIAVSSSNIDSKFASLKIYTGSVDTYISASNLDLARIHESTSSLNTFSASILLYTASINTYTSSINLDLARIHESTSSLNTFSASVLGHISDINTYTASINLDLARIHESTSSLNSYTSSQDTKNETLRNYTGSINLDLARIHESTSSLNTFSASVLGHISDINTYTSSINLDLARIHESTASLNSYTSSLKNAITVTGENAASTTTIKGNLIVEGTQTSINSTAIVLGDNIIELNGTSVANGGLLVKDPTDASFITGSLLWDSSNDYWKAGQLGSESKILLAGGGGIVSSSAQVTSLLPSGVISGSQQVTSSLDLRYLMIDGDSVVSSSAQIVSILSDLNSYTGSQDTKNITLGTYSGSNDTKWNTLSNVTASLINATSSYETNGRGIISGSSQVAPLLPTGTVSGSSQILGGSDILSGSTAIVSTTTPSISKTGSLWFNNDDGNLYIKYESQWIPTFGLPLLPSGLVSASSDTTNVDITITGGTISANLKGGVVSGSQQLTSSYDGRYALSSSFQTLLGANTLASLGSAAFYYVSQSIADGNPNTLGSAFAIKEYVDDAMVLAGAGDITAVNAGNGLSGGAESGSATLTLNTGSAHFTNGVDARLIPLTSLNSYTSSQDTKNSTLGNYTSSLDTKNITLQNLTGSFATTGSNTFKGEQIISSSLIVTNEIKGVGNIFLQPDVNDARYFQIYNTAAPSGNDIHFKGNADFNYFGDDINYLKIDDSAQTITITSANGVFVSSSLNVTGAVSASAGFTGSIIGVINATNGVISGSSQLDGTTIANLTITNLTSVNQTASVIFSSGSNKFGDFNNDTHEFTGSVKITGSIEITGASTATSFNGAINATNGVISGSSQVDATATTNFNSGIKTKLDAEGVISGSSQVTRTLQQITDTGASTSNAITITNATASITTGTGALVITGGIGLGGSINAGGDIIAYSSSDIRLKNNIRPISNPLEKISKIGGYNFVWNSEIQNTYIGNDIGVIAQEIEAVLPELVQTRENGYKAVKYDKLVALLIEGIKELTKQVDELKTKVENNGTNN